MTFFAMINAIFRTAAVSVRVDVDPKTFSNVPTKIEECFTYGTKDMLHVYFQGLLYDTDTSIAIFEKYDLMVIEDCARAVESERQGCKAGTFSGFGGLGSNGMKNAVTSLRDSRYPVIPAQQSVAAG